MKILDQRGQELDSHNYNVGTNVSGGFALGNVGAKDDFWLCGLQTDEGVPEPLLCGSILDSKGSLLIRINNSHFTYNPARCERVISSSDHGLSTHFRDGYGEVVLQVDTVPKDGGKLIETAVLGKFHGKNGDLLYEATRGYCYVNDALPFRALVGGQIYGDELSPAQGKFLETTVRTRGLINHILTGHFTAVELQIDGAFMTDFYANECKLLCNSLFWMNDGNISRTQIGLSGPALALAHMLRQSQDTEVTFEARQDNIRDL